MSRISFLSRPSRASLVLPLLLALAACRPHSRETPATTKPTGDAAAARSDEEVQRRRREDMVAHQLVDRGITDERVLAAMRRVPRHRFVPEAERDEAYADRPLPIGLGQTISQPFIVGFMSQALELAGTERVLEVGCGSGYQAAVLGELAREVWTIEILEPLAERASATLAELGYLNVHVRTGDGYLGWPEHAPFDAILLAAAPDHVPQPLVDQLAPGGRLILPLGDVRQELVLLRRTPEGLERESILPVSFVPMTGRAQEQRR